MKHRNIIIGSIIILLAGAIALWATTVAMSYGTQQDLTVTNLLALADSATAGWQSDVIDNRTTLALDYEVCVRLDMANSAAASPSLVYVYVCPAFYDTTSTAWRYNDGGTATLPSGAEGTYTIGANHNLVLAATMAYVATDGIIEKTFHTGPALGYACTDGFSLIIINDSGAAVESDAGDAIIRVKPVKRTVS